MIKIKEAKELTGRKGTEIRHALKTGKINGKQDGKFYYVDQDQLMVWHKGKDAKKQK